MKRSINLIFGIILLNCGFLYGQNQVVTAPAVYGIDIPEYLVTYEVIPFIKRGDCNDPKNNTIIFEIPTTQEYYETIRVGQEVTSWFRVFGDEDISANMISKNKDRWKLIIVGKRIMSKEKE